MGADSLASYAGFVPADAPRFQQVPPPERSQRYSDEQLYALARYVYSLQPPPNPNTFDAVAARGEQVFKREGCALKLHAAAVDEQQQLTPAAGFRDSCGALDEVRHPANLSRGPTRNSTMRTRRGTGYYKVPSLKGVWYRSMFGHSGWSATLEDWFDPFSRRVREDYVPTGWRPSGP